ARLGQPRRARGDHRSAGPGGALRRGADGGGSGAPVRAHGGAVARARLGRIRRGGGADVSEVQAVHTAFDAPQRELGCEFMEWEGWLWPNHFGDPVAEHRAVREGVGVWDESPLRKWDFRGRDALRAADRIFTNDMLGLAPGQVRY